MDDTGVKIILLLVGALIGYFFQVLSSIRSNQVSEIQDVISDINRIEEFACAYWLASAVVDGENDKALAAKLRGAITATGAFRGRAQKLLGDCFDEYRNLDDSLFDSSTGGKFESTEKEPDYSRVVEVMQLCNQIRSTLRRARARRFWAH